MVEYKKQFPKAELNLQVRTPEKIVEELSQGMANIGVTLWELLPEQTPEVLKNAGLQYETFGSQHNICKNFAKNCYCILFQQGQLPLRRIE